MFFSCLRKKQEVQSLNDNLEHCELFRQAFGWMVSMVIFFFLFGWFFRFWGV